MKRAPRWGCLWLVAAALGCTTPPSHEQLEATLRRVASAEPELARGARVVVVHADSEMAAWAQLAAASAEGPSAMSRGLAQSFEGAARTRLDFAVGGPYDSLNDRTLLDAFALVRAPRLSGLRVLLVSPKPPSEKLREAARARGARLMHRAFPP
ncbi:MAG: hypothetical protein OEM49_08435 [Myxococcales bacterium]|nr:hypothetical protein [Myxococcales bacterium]MDH5565747.1 hypothetical protein [Myxococcales bacterium]